MTVTLYVKWIIDKKNCNKVAQHNERDRITKLNVFIRVFDLTLSDLTPIIYNSCFKIVLFSLYLIAELLS